MEEKIREIISVFIKVPPDQIVESTPIDRRAVQSSILVHRMYARLGEAGFVVDDYAGIAVFGDLMRKQGSAGSATSIVVPAPGGEEEDSQGVGIDMEEVAALPRADDLRKEEFYVRNFTPGELAYCILQPDPYASLTGLFAVKEAIVKADGRYRNRPFNMIGIGHSPQGRPIFPGFRLSISHAGGMAVGMAVRDGEDSRAEYRERYAFAPPAGRKAGPARVGWLQLLLTAAIVVAIAVLVVVMRKH
ncbi:MAG TPA: 4'-phosphopantetheinyl transferase superfamily protein [Puia sp.]|nr:4'-phosphopantetheinyl transferase superfamily protein [Puia sp.]